MQTANTFSIASCTSPQAGTVWPSITIYWAAQTTFDGARWPEMTFEARLAVFDPHQVLTHRKDDMQTTMREHVEGMASCMRQLGSSLEENSMMRGQLGRQVMTDWWRCAVGNYSLNVASQLPLGLANPNMGVGRVDCQEMVGRLISSSDPYCETALALSITNRLWRAPHSDEGTFYEHFGGPDCEDRMNSVNARPDRFHRPLPDIKTLDGTFADLDGDYEYAHWCEYDDLMTTYRIESIRGGRRMTAQQRRATVSRDLLQVHGKVPAWSGDWDHLPGTGLPDQLAENSFTQTSMPEQVSVTPNQADTM